MYTLVGFAPSIAFYVAMRLVTVEATLGIAAGVALRVAGWNWARSGSPKVLEIGSVVVFAALAASTAVAHWRWSFACGPARGQLRIAGDCLVLTVAILCGGDGAPSGRGRVR